MKSLILQSERFTPTGNIASEGIRNQLGRPRLDRLAVLVREAAQNAWDAKRDDSDVVTFGMACNQLDDDQLWTLRNEVFATLPEDPSQSLAELLERVTAPHDGHPLTVLTIYDRGTTGLGGPTRGDASRTSDEAHDFVDFLRNIGQPPDKSRGGGTFGYGKAALYLSSAVNTILVHTRCRNNGRVESRFMVSAMTEHYRQGGLGYTGRHWWGREANDGVVDPVVGRMADRLATSLGMPVPDADELGTTIMLLEPRLGERDLDQVMNYLQAQMLWNFWPKMIAWDHEPGPRMIFETSLNGHDLPIPHPSSVPPLAAFVDALQSIRHAEVAGRSRSPSKVMTLVCHRPKQNLGLLKLSRVVRKDRLEVDYGEDTELPEFVERCHHVALLRRAELVVTYHPGPVLPNNYVEYAGVFLADDELDRVYAASEPPTHDEWRPENLADSRDRTLVRTTFRRIDAATKELVAPAATTHESQTDRPLARLSTYLGGLLVDSGGGSSGGGEAPPSPETNSSTDVAPTRGEASEGSGKDQEDPPRRAQRRTTPKIDLSPDVELLDEQGTLIRVFRAEVTHTKDVLRTELYARAHTILAGGAEERDAPVGAEQPSIVSWRAPSGRVQSLGQRAIVDEHDEGIWEIRVTGAPDSVIALELQATAVSA
jgi:hypothetical protein